MSNSGFEYIEYISDEDIRQCADEYRNHICPEGEIPLDIFNIVEFDLDIQLTPVSGLRTDFDTETVLLSDFKTILIDNDDFIDSRKETRLKYTLAHELGHICLHKEKTNKFLPSNIDEYLSLMMSVSASQYGRFEYQAYEFAGRLLVPKENLITSLEPHKEEIKGFLNKYPEGIHLLIPHLAPKINDIFGVSTDVIERRLEKEEIDFKNV